MKANELKSMVSNNRKAIIAAAVITIALIIAAFAVSCSNASAVSSGMEPETETKSLEDARLSSGDAEDGPEDNEEDTHEDVIAEAPDVSSETTVAEADNSDSGYKKDVAANSPGESAASSQSTGVKTDSTSNNNSEQSKHWVEDTERVWVVDKAAWTEQIPGCRQESCANCQQPLACHRHDPHSSSNDTSR